MIDSVAIETTSNAFLPEAYAYRNMFRDKGISCNLVEKNTQSLECYDLVILFHGFHPFWKKYPGFVIGEYNSLSVGRFGRLKDIAKRLFNVKADYYIFLNDIVRKKLFFSKSSAHSLRSMGFSSPADPSNNVGKEFDVIYCGSNRIGLRNQIVRLANLGLKVAVAGFKFDQKHQNIVSYGKVTPAETGRLLLKAKWGLNYTPDVFPLNVQDSTKVIEYCAAGLGVVTNRYEWVNEFERIRGARFLDLDNLSSLSYIEKFEFIVPDVSDLEWKRKVEVLFDELNAHFSITK